MDIEARDSQGRTPLQYAAMLIIGDDPSEVLIESGIPNLKWKSTTAIISYNFFPF